MEALIITLTVLIMVFEFFKILIPNQNWKILKKSYFRRIKDDRQFLNHTKFDKLFVVMSYIYLIFMIILLFTTFWWISISLFILSIVSHGVLSTKIKIDAIFTRKINIILLIDNLLTIVLLYQILN